MVLPAQQSAGSVKPGSSTNFLSQSPNAITNSAQQLRSVIDRQEYANVVQTDPSLSKWDRSFADA